MSEMRHMEVTCLGVAEPEAETVVKCLNGRPLQEADLRRGLALRIVSCVRASSDDLSCSPQTMLWSVICLRKARRSEVAPRISGLIGIFHAAVATRLMECDVLVEETLWKASEYEIPLPFLCRTFSLRIGTYVCHIDAQESSHQIDAHFEQIRNILVDGGYSRWLAGDRARAQKLAVPAAGPLMSIVVPAYNTPSAYLREMILSVMQQTYPRWELVIVNASPDNEMMAAVLTEFEDDRIIILQTARNLGIAGNTNLGISASHGAYVSFLDHDDFIEPHALAVMVRAIERDKSGANLIFCDEDSFDEQGAFVLPLFKPEGNLDLLYSNNYVIHWLTVSRSMLDEVERSRGKVDGAQDYDLTLKVFERSSAICRIPHILYHWRIHAGSTNINPDSKPYAGDAGSETICSALHRRKIAAKVRPTDVVFTYEVEFLGLPAFARRLHILVDQIATEELTQFAEELRSAGLSVSVSSWSSLLSADASPGAAILKAGQQSDLVLFLNEEIRIDAAGIRRLMSYFQREEVFAVSPRVVREDGLMDFAGAIVRPDGTLGRLNRLLPETDGGYLGRAHRPYDAAVLNGECCLVRTRELERFGFDDRFATFEYMLADTCLNAFSEGLLNVYVPYVTAHLRSPRSVIVEPPCMRKSPDGERLLRRHRNLLSEGDPSHNPNFDPESLYYRLNWNHAPQE